MVQEACADRAFLYSKEAEPALCKEPGIGVSGSGRVLPSWILPCPKESALKSSKPRWLADKQTFRNGEENVFLSGLTSEA